MNNTFTYTKTWVVNDNFDFIVERLLDTFWTKEKDAIFYKERNNYKIKVNGAEHPFWKINIIPTSEAFDALDWKIKQDLRKLKNLRYVNNKQLFINKQNKNNIDYLLTYIEGGGKIAHDDNFLLFLDQDNNLRVFKIAAWTKLQAQDDGWYLGKNRLL